MLIKIETYWNVNLFTNAFQGVATVIKIETYWNVNVNDVFMINPETRLK